jgi:phosphopantothenoylcysteine decarboxylase/phosphopantothenate--cysteine ligase
MGRMAEPEDIAAAVDQALGAPDRERHERSPGNDDSPEGDLAGATVLVTAGPTYEPIDAVRFVGNRSSGRMGFEVAAEAARRGARVFLVSGPTHLPDPPGVRVDRVETAEEMRASVMGRFGEVDAVVKAAAVSDFRPAEPATGKLKKEAGPPEVRLEPTADILGELGGRKDGRVLVGFAAETDDLEAAGRKKLAEKNLDLIVVNEVGRPDTGFDVSTNRALILSRDGHDEPLRDWTKPSLAAAICDRLARLLR